jgi:hypothetical protein
VDFATVFCIDGSFHALPRISSNHLISLKPIYELFEMNGKGREREREVC